MLIKRKLLGSKAASDGAGLLSRQRCGAVPHSPQRHQRAAATAAPAAKLYCRPRGCQFATWVVTTEGSCQSQGGACGMDCCWHAIRAVGVRTEGWVPVAVSQFCALVKGCWHCTQQSDYLIQGYKVCSWASSVSVWHKGACTLRRSATTRCVKLVMHARLQLTYARATICMIVVMPACAYYRSCSKHITDPHLPVHLWIAAATSMGHLMLTRSCKNWKPAG